MLHILAILLPVLTLTAFGSLERLFAPGPNLWPHWQAHDPSSRLTVDHSLWDVLLARYWREGSDGVARLDYDRLRRQSKRELSDYIGTLARTPVSKLSRDEQLAYWINLYNAATVQVAVEHYPVASIRDIDISPGLFASGPWDAPVVSVEGQNLTLNDIEHRILRPIWQDPRIHYVVNCASVGCPNLAPTAYRAADIDARFDAAARAYVNDPRGVSIENDTVTVSSIYNWFVEDFGGDEQGVLRHLRRYADPALAKRLAALGKIDATRYDWALNDIQRR